MTAVWESDSAFTAAFNMVYAGKIEDGSSMDNGSYGWIASFKTESQGSFKVYYLYNGAWFSGTQFISNGVTVRCVKDD